MRAKDLIEVVADAVENGVNREDWSSENGLVVAEKKLSWAMKHAIMAYSHEGAINHIHLNDVTIEYFNKVIDALIECLGVERIEAHTEPMKFVKKAKHGR